jgi:uncharacterized protein (UPF0147 family)
MNDDFFIDLPDLDEPTLPPALSSRSMISPFSSSDGFQPINKWDPRLLMDLAVGVEELPTILARFDLTMEDFDDLLKHPVFRRELAVMTRDVQENGATFRAKAKIQAESYLPVLDNIVNDENVPTGIRLDAIKSAVRWGDLEPKESRGQDNAAATVNIQINF